MIVYVVIGEWDYEPGTVVGVYSTLALAQERASEAAKDYDSMAIEAYSLDDSEEIPEDSI